MVKLNAVSNSAHAAGSAAAPAAQLLEMMRSYTLVLLGLTASSNALPLLSALPPRVDELVACAPVITALITT